jgi:hypothetical protein
MLTTGSWELGSSITFLSDYQHLTSLQPVNHCCATVSASVPILLLRPYTCLYATPIELHVIELHILGLLVD